MTSTIIRYNQRDPMEHSLLPIDICEEIIDACGQENFIRSRYLILSACALTCKGWHPRSRYNLFQRVRFRHPNQIIRFLESITTQPFLADLVVELHVTPAEAHRHGFFPFADPLLVQKLHSVQKLALRQFQWISLPPKYTTIYIGKYTSVTCLEVHNNVFNSGGDLIRLVWHLPELTQLSCGLNTFTMTSSAENLESLCALQKSKPYACRKLYILKLWVSTMVLDLRGDGAHGHSSEPRPISSHIQGVWFTGCLFALGSA